MSQQHPLTTSRPSNPYAELPAASQQQVNRDSVDSQAGMLSQPYPEGEGYATHPPPSQSQFQSQHQHGNTLHPSPIGRTQSRSRHSIMEETEDELTEDERIEYEKGLITWGKAKNWRFWIRKEWIWWYIAFVLIVVVVALMAFFHHSIIDWLSPFVRKLRTIKAGFCIPVAILFVLSFPPLFGNEIVMILVGIVWGLGKGFAIVAVGVFLGETTLFLVFKYWCRHRAERMTRKSLNYACLSESVREGGFLMAWVVRLSVIPTHYTTAVLAVCGLKTWQFVLALIGSLPKQLISVYVGVVLGQTNASTNSHVISDCVFAACALITLGALYFIYKRMIKVRKGVLISMREDLHKRHVEVPAPPEDTLDQPSDASRWGGKNGDNRTAVFNESGNEARR
ncbi:uncharacterized protein IL334_004899 [Kwoniella shivajii]|uniref:Golgi apparatus membrane protein TVP38 n=1 Tax=Kwoniella shivajii TaxID=564305 RepID=A0ABZ1D3D9_9TREE|nr:hypothetical protein IL334_004899 [Kwoniella shivajii]